MMIKSLLKPSQNNAPVLAYGAREDTEKLKKTP